MEELDYKKLRNIQRDERDGTALTPLPDDFYTKMEKFIRAKKDEIRKSNSLSDIKELENIAKTLRGIRELREQKIVFKALKSEKRDVEGMTKDERRAYEKVAEVLADSRARVDDILQDAEPDETTEGKPFRKIRALKEVPAYKGTDAVTYGPFKLGDEMLLPEHEAEWLVKEKLAEVVGG